jgi:pilus assembly protein TadC
MSCRTLVQRTLYALLLLWGALLAPLPGAVGLAQSQTPPPAAAATAASGGAPIVLFLAVVGVLVGFVVVYIFLFKRQGCCSPSRCHWGETTPTKPRRPGP